MRVTKTDFVKARLSSLNTRQRNVLKNIHTTPTPVDIRYSSVVSLLKALDLKHSYSGGGGSHLNVLIKNDESDTGCKMTVVRDHPRSTVKRYIIKDLSALLKKKGYEL